MTENRYIINPDIGKEDDDEVEIIKKGVRLQVKMNKLNGSPVARYDAKKKRPYLEYPDGRREYSNEF